MYIVTEASPITIFIIVASMMLVSSYFIAMYSSNGASLRKGVIISTLVAIWGAIMFYFCLSYTISKLGLLGLFVIPLSWIIPSLIIYIKRDWFLEKPISQKWLVGLQVFRIIGGVFLIEMVVGDIPAVFAYPAGIGDLIVGCFALIGLIYFRHRENFPNKFVILIIVIGIIDFISAGFFGFTTGESPLQLFFPPEKSTLIYFPTGMIPLFFVPIAIMFHTLSWLNFRKYDSK